jgi:two-component system nitrogen regulation response regulator GlnG
MQPPIHVGASSRVRAGALAELFSRFDLAGPSPAMQEVFRRAIIACQFNELSVLIEGENGTPKRRLALAILYLDPSRLRMPLFALSCAELRRLLANLRHGGRSEAPSVTEQWQHLMRAAQGGTLFLDDIGALDPRLQQALLTVVRRPPGAVRVIAATELPAAELVKEGLLDEELSGWLGLIRIPLPPLRGRPEDVEAQARHFLNTTRADPGSPVTEFGPGVLEALRQQRWDGNTAQLEATLREALTAALGGTTLRLDHLPAWVRRARPAEPAEPELHPGDWVADHAEGAEHPGEQAATEYEGRVLRSLLRRQECGRFSPAAEPLRPDHQIDAGR